MTEGISTSPRIPASPVRGHRRKKTAENWDDDFEFVLASKTKPSTSSRPSSARNEDGRALSTTKLNGRRASSPIENWDDEDWDEKAAGPSRSPPRSKRTPIPLNISTANNIPPRMSSSHSLGLSPPSPESKASFSTSAPPDRPVHTSSEYRSQPPVAAPGSKSKLLKRHPSTSFVPSQPNETWGNGSETSLSPMDSAHRSSPHLPRSTSRQSIRHSKSRELMPPPTMPANLGRRRSVKKPNEEASDVWSAIRESSLPLSPSSEQIEAAEAKKPGFWKRFSGAQGSSQVSKGLARSPGRSRSRASSTSSRIPSDPSLHPPLPPYPANFRSPSSTSTSSTQSASSTTSDRSGRVASISSMLRRSSSRLSGQNSPKLPPSSYPYAGRSESATRSSLNIGATDPVPIPLSADDRPSPTLPSSSSFSQGFHLPSPSPKSPYNIASVGLGMPPLPHSTSFPGRLTLEQQRRPSDSDTETEAEGNGQTPKRRKKIRPVSALPAPRRESGWAGDGWKGFAVSPTAPAVPSARQTSGHTTQAGTDSSSGTNAAPASTSSTLKRIGNLSKEHGRRLSGGWKFGTSGSSSSTESKTSKSKLETVIGSPSKPGQVSGLDRRISDADSSEHVHDAADMDLDDERRDQFRAGAVSAPGSRIQNDLIGQLSTHTSETAVSDTAKADKQRRRQSWNDFVIPRGVLEKQKELKQGIGAVKQFATGVESLKSLLDIHASILRKIINSTESDEITLFTTLERDFAQYWEMATVLIEVGSTGQSTMSSSTDNIRSRRVTLAAEDAKAAADAMRRAYTDPHAPDVPRSFESQYTPKKTSLPEPMSPSLDGPPIASPTHWRASTGRQDLSKRQLEVLRTMLRTPISDNDRPSLGVRQASTLSVSSTQSHITKSAIIPSRGMSNSGPNASDTPDSKISYPSPGDSAYIVPSGSFPSPITAGIAHPQQAKRRSSRAGLAGLKDFLRGLRTQKSSGTLNGKTPTKATHDIPPLPSPVPPMPPSPLVSPTNTAGPSFARDEVFYPTQRHTVAAPLGPATRRAASPDKKLPSRPNIRNIFRTSSGNWSDLVRGDASRRSGEHDRVPSVPSGADLTRESSSTRRISQTAGARVKANVSSDIRRPSVTQLSQTVGPSSTVEVGNIPKSPRWGRKTRSSVSGPSDPPLSPTKAHDERTVRPNRKSRMKGLGWPEEGVETNPPLTGSPAMSPRKGSGGTLNSIGTFSSSNTLSSSHSRLSHDSGGMSGSRRASEVEDGDEGMPTIALTPENLPVLLEYLRQCEGKLSEWRTRAEELMAL